MVAILKRSGSSTAAQSLRMNRSIDQLIMLIQLGLPQHNGRCRSLSMQLVESVRRYRCRRAGSGLVHTGAGGCWHRSGGNGDHRWSGRPLGCGARRVGAHALDSFRASGSCGVNWRWRWHAGRWQNLGLRHNRTSAGRGGDGGRCR